MPQPYYHIGGDGPPLHLALANGFPPGTYRPLLTPLTDRYTVFSLPPRALWTDPPPPSTGPDWHTMADDLLNGLRAHNATGVIGVGHSMGGVATMLAAVREPERFRGVVLLDPTVFPRAVLWTLAVLRVMGLQGRFPLVKKALRRRAQFESTEAAFAYWRGKRLFSDWDDAVLQIYAAELTQPAADGGVELAWAPAWEAQYYATIATDSWTTVRRLAATGLPVLLLRGTHSNTFFEGPASAFQRMLPNLTYAEIESGHLFPQAAPDATRAPIEAWLANL
jgi:pimeloyl-ACP methyl ester carboxylesterase